MCGWPHHPLVLTGCGEKPRSVFLAEVHDLKGEHVAGRRLLRRPHHPKGERVTRHVTPAFRQPQESSYNTCETKCKMFFFTFCH